MSERPKTLWGIPIVVVEGTPHLEALFGRLPTWQEVLEAGSWEEAVKRTFVKVKVKVKDGKVRRSTEDE